MGEFEFVPHTADIAVRARGADMADLLRTAALGIAAAATARESLPPRRLPDIPPRAVTSEAAPDEEGLLVNFLNEVIFQSEVNAEVYTDMEILEHSLDGGVRALLYPDPAAAPVYGIKAATFYDLHITHTTSGVEATIVFDV